MGFDPQLENGTMKYEVKVNLYAPCRVRSYELMDGNRKSQPSMGFVP